MKVWIYLDGRQQGPFEAEDLKAKEGFDRNTRIWFEGLPKWTPAGEVPELEYLFDDIDGTQIGSDKEKEADKSAEWNEKFVHYQPSASVKSPYAPGRMYRAAQLDEPCPPTYLGWSIFLLICCCSPFSLAALIASIMVSSYYSNGNLAKSKKASEWAAWLIMISFALGMLPSMFMSALMG